MRLGIFLLATAVWIAGFFAQAVAAETSQKEMPKFCDGATFFRLGSCAQVGGSRGFMAIASEPAWAEIARSNPEAFAKAQGKAVPASVGQPVMALVFIENAKRDAHGSARVLCDIDVVEPSGAIAVRRRSVECLSGPPRKTGPILAEPIVAKLTPTAKGPWGTWQIKVAMRDQVAKTTSFAWGAVTARP